MAQAQRQAPARDWPFEVKPLHPALGCEISGITLAQAVEPKMFGKVYEAFLDYELILFRDVDLPEISQPSAGCSGLTWNGQSRAGAWRCA